MNQITTEKKEEHKEWLDEIRHLEKELDSFSEINGKIIEKAVSKEEKKQVEHFENQFTIQKGRLDQMKHNIKIYGADSEKGQSELDEYKNYYNELKSEFEKFNSNYN